MRHPKSIAAFGVFSPQGKIQTTRVLKGDAADAASIYGGTNWQIDGYTIKPVTITWDDRPDSHEAGAKPHE